MNNKMTYARLILRGNFNKRTKVARQILDDAGVRYRFEGRPDCEKGPLTLGTPGGRFYGVGAVYALFGKRDVSLDELLEAA